jgi:hypothetical protein
VSQITYEVTIEIEDEDCEIPTERNVEVWVTTAMEKDPGFKGVDFTVEASRC